MNNDIKVTMQKGNLTLQNYKKCWCWYLILGLALMMLGIWGSVYSVTVTTVAMLWIGVIIIVAGTLQCIYAFFADHWQGILFHLILGAIALAIGIFIIAYPLKASTIFTLIIGCLLVASGILRIIFSLNIRQTNIWWLIFLIGAISLILGILILSHWPVSGLWVIGFFISIEVFLIGWSMLITSIAAKMQS